jgi:hypothetical protein
MHGLFFTRFIATYRQKKSESWKKTSVCRERPITKIQSGLDYCQRIRMSADSPFALKIDHKTPAKLLGRERYWVEEMRDSNWPIIQPTKG